MSIFSWILLGLIAGLLGSKIVSRRGEGMFLNIGLGIVGAVTGGYLLNRFGSISLYHQYTNRNSDIPTFSFDKHQVGINVTAQF